MSPVILGDSLRWKAAIKDVKNKWYLRTHSRDIILFSLLSEAIASDRWKVSQRWPSTSVYSPTAFLTCWRAESSSFIFWIFVWACQLQSPSWLFSALENSAIYFFFFGYSLTYLLYVTTKTVGNPTSAGFSCLQPDLFFFSKTWNWCKTTHKLCSHFPTLHFGVLDSEKLCRMMDSDFSGGLLFSFWKECLKIEKKME